jgi:hypothetical protein
MAAPTHHQHSGDIVTLQIKMDFDAFMSETGCQFLLERRRSPGAVQFGK